MLKPKTAANTQPSLVRAALDAPLPSKVAALAAAVERARKAVDQAKAAGNEARVVVPQKARQAVAVARRALDTAYVQQDIADRLGEDDGPSDADIEALEKAHTDAVARLASAESAGVVWDEQIEQRKAALRDALSELENETAPWYQRAKDAVDAQMAHAAALLGEANRACYRLRMTGGYLPSIPRAFREGSYPFPESIEIRDEIEALTETRFRALNAA